jgi:hypothetical protein
MRALIATLAFAFVAAQPAFAQKPPPPEQVAPTDYTEEWRRNFVAGCTDEALRIEICECALRNIERVVPYAESHALVAQLIREHSKPIIRLSLVACQPWMPRSW